MTKKYRISGNLWRCEYFDIEVFANSKKDVYKNFDDGLYEIEIYEGLQPFEDFDKLELLSIDDAKRKGIEDENYFNIAKERIEE